MSNRSVDALDVLGLFDSLDSMKLAMNGSPTLGGKYPEDAQLITF
ncbi:hypothetical protein [Moritella sp.]|nr:hypothetical protein [Moritella sp.]